MENFLTNFYKGLVRAGDGFKHYFLLIIRLYWGIALLETGWGKLHNIEGVAQFFASLNIPLPELNAYFVGSIEFFGGIMLTFGLASRFGALAVICVLCGAFATAHREALLNVFHDPDTFFNQAPFLFLMASLIVFSFGPGKFSIDNLIAKRCHRS